MAQHGVEPFNKCFSAYFYKPASTRSSLGGLPATPYDLLLPRSLPSPLRKLLLSQPHALRRYFQVLVRSHDLESALDRELPRRFERNGLVRARGAGIGELL